MYLCIMCKEIDVGFRGKYSYNRPRKDIKGEKFGRLTVIEWLGFIEVGNQGKRRSYWKCKCECGNEFKVDQTSLSTGNTKSCGCSWKDIASRCYKGLHYAVISAVLNNYIQSAKKRNYEFILSRDEFEKLIKSECFYCKCSHSNSRRSKNDSEEDFLYNGIDRVDNNKGYTSNNVVACCNTCNFMKKDIPQNEFIKWIKRVYESRKW